MNRFLVVLAGLVLSLGAAQAGPQTTPTNVAPCGSFPAGAASLVCSCTGSESGTVWGSGPYTADSDLCVAARHAGVIGTLGGVVNVLGLDGLQSYPGSAANGVTTSTWSSYGASIDFAPGTPIGQACDRFPGGDAAYSCVCSGAETGTVWGSGPYTADSDLCVAARHAGVIDDRGGAITVLGFAGLVRYSGSSQNGVTTSAWGGYDASVIFNRN
ncbi:MAG: hypothetical protein KJZ59_03865 [Pararhodobacter sp.]|nr:hypothetical protein [Pararhodobacter sp.]